MVHRKNDYLSMIGMLKGENVFTYRPYEQTQAAELIEQINAILAGISADDRNALMDNAVLNQPVSAE